MPVNQLFQKVKRLVDNCFCYEMLIIEAVFPFIT